MLANVPDVVTGRHVMPAIHFILQVSCRTLPVQHLTPSISPSCTTKMSATAKTTFKKMKKVCPSSEGPSTFSSVSVSLVEPPTGGDSGYHNDVWTTTVQKWLPYFTLLLLPAPSSPRRGLR
ncbi:hypothetical protein Pcinc_019753 [Petrolisthes cinctipes]|uniref:Uncharacterized protein n=1 Tax=Petrolisthes cinctipes TaxID=88211 RepID=A0AAE1FP46_PETCI|nr:hypothetical protein Pcinc_019753 [Petrolisthes cinctipes]